MNKTLVIGIAIVAVLGIGLTAYMLLSNKSPRSNTQTVTQNTPTTQSAATKSLRDLMMMRKTAELSIPVAATQEQILAAPPTELLQILI